MRKLNYTHNKTNINGILLHYVVGEGKGDPVVLLHDFYNRSMNGYTLFPN
jgi:hypothetical protein